MSAATVQSSRQHWEDASTIGTPGTLVAQITMSHTSQRRALQLVETTVATATFTRDDDEWEPMKPEDERLIRSMLAEQTQTLTAALGTDHGVGNKVEALKNEFHEFRLSMTSDFTALKTEYHTTAKLLKLIFGGTVAMVVAQAIFR